MRFRLFKPGRRSRLLVSGLGSLGVLALGACSGKAFTADSTGASGGSVSVSGGGSGGMAAGSGGEIPIEAGQGGRGGFGGAGAPRGGGPGGEPRGGRGGKPAGRRGLVGGGDFPRGTHPLSQGPGLRPGGV